MTNSKSPVYTAMRHMPEGETSERIKMAGSLGILITSFKGDSVTRSSTICAYSAGSNYPSILKSFHISVGLMILSITPFITQMSVTGCRPKPIAFASAAQRSVQRSFKADHRAIQRFTFSPQVRSGTSSSLLHICR